MNFENFLSNLKSTNTNYNSAEQQNAFLQGFNVCRKMIQDVTPLLDTTIIGIVGKTGSGKTTFAKDFYLDNNKFRVTDENERIPHFALIEADKVYHKMLEDKEIHGLEKCFGSCIKGKDGKIVRQLLSSIVFADETLLNKLNDLVLPQITHKLLELMAELANSEWKFTIILDAPTLIESGMHNICDSVVFVKTDRETRKQRIMQRDGLTEQQAEARMRFEKDDSFYEQFADKIVNGNI